MHTLAAAAATHTVLRFTTNAPIQFVDITARIEALVETSGIRLGVVTVQSRHTTTAVIVNENEPLLLGDLVEMLDRLAPADAEYRHDDSLARTANVIAGERRNGHAHCRAALLGSTVFLNIAEGRLQTGRWQRVLLVELDGAREREVSVLVTGERDR